MTEQIIVLEQADDFLTGNKLYKLIRTTYENGCRTKVEYAAKPELQWKERYTGDSDGLFLVIQRENRDYPRALGEHKFDWEPKRE